MNKPVVCIQGPTASGKSDLADSLALHYGGEIISADSMQIYRGMDIGTAKQPVDSRSVPYHLMDICDPGQSYSASLFQEQARNLIDGVLHPQEKLPILCGGTGFYVRAVIDEMDFAPGEQVHNPVRDKYSQLVEKLGPEGLHRLLQEKDPESAACVHVNDVKRVIRALEMYEAGESYAKRKNAFKSMDRHYRSLNIALNVERSVLYSRIDARVDGMMDAGLLAEVSSLLDKGFREGLTANQAIGYKELVAYLDGQWDLDTAVEKIKQGTRRYAKRQMTWLRGIPDINWIDATDKDKDQVFQDARCLMDGFLYEGGK